MQEYEVKITEILEKVVCVNAENVIDAEEQVQDAFTYLKQIEVLMKRLLDIGRLESGKQVLQKEEISLEELLYSCAKMFDTKQERIVVEIINETETPFVLTKL